MFDLIGRMVREHASMIIVFKGSERDAHAVTGLITKEHIADSVAESIGPYAAGESSF